MISIKEAAQRSVDFCQQIFPNAQDVLLEEVERDENNRFWYITISYLAPTVKRSLASNIPTGALSQTLQTLGELFPPSERHYKIFKVDAQTGEVISMKIRELQS